MYSSSGIRYTLFYGLAILLLAGCIYTHLLTGNAGDKNWLFLQAHLLLGDKKAYVDTFEVNPPLVMWLFTLFAALGRNITFLKDYTLYTIAGFFVIATVIAVAVRLVNHHRGFEGNARRIRHFMLLLCLMFITWERPSYFLDRDHLYFMLTFCYMLRFMPTLAQRPLPLALRLLIGCMAALGFTIKPHSFFLFVGIQLMLLSFTRRLKSVLSIENAIICTAAVIYIACVYVCTPDYIYQVLPIAWATYSAYGAPLNHIAYLMGAFLIAGCSFVDMRRHATPYRKDIVYFMGVCCAQLCYALANNAWGYSYKPLLGMLLFTSAWVMWEFIYLRKHAGKSSAAARRYAMGARQCAIVIVGATLLGAYDFYAIWQGACTPDSQCGWDAAFLDRLKKDNIHSIGVITIGFTLYENTEMAHYSGHFPVPVFGSEAAAVFSANGIEEKTRFPCLWMLPKLFTAGDAFAQKYDWIRQYVSRSFAQDMESGKPDIMIVENSPGYFFRPRKPIDFIAYLSEGESGFAKAWAHYSKQGTIDYCPGSPDAKKDSPAVGCRFDIYRRIP